MDKARKSEEISALSERFGRAKAAFIVDFKGLNVEQVTTLRKKLFPLDAEMKVVRNTLARQALKNHPSENESIGTKLIGTNALVFAYGDVSSPAKLLADFSKDAEQLQLKTGVMGGKALNEAQIKYLATLPAKEVLQAKLLSVLQAPSQKFVQTLAAPSSTFVRLLAAYQNTKTA